MRRTLFLLLSFLAGVAAGTGGVIWQLKYGQGPVVCADPPPAGEPKCAVEEPKPVAGMGWEDDPVPEPTAVIETSAPENHPATVAAAAEREPLPFFGSYRCTLDDEVGVVLPKEVVEMTANFKGERLFVWLQTDATAPRLSLCSESQVRSELAAIPVTPPTAGEGGRKLRQLLSSIRPVRLESDGRLLLPPELAHRAGLQDTVVVLGVMDRLEIWNAATWETYSEYPATADVAGVLAEPVMNDYPCTVPSPASVREKLKSEESEESGNGESEPEMSLDDLAATICNVFNKVAGQFGLDFEIGSQPADPEQDLRRLAEQSNDLRSIEEEWLRFWFLDESGEELRDCGSGLQR
jgi:MraZ protein